MKPGLTLVVKYHPPSPRISGVIGFISVLARALAAHVDLHVITSEVEGAPDEEEMDGYRVTRVGRPFPLTAARALRRGPTTSSLVVSSMYEMRRAGLYFTPLLRRLRGQRHAFLQATISESGPSTSLARALRGAAPVFVGSESMLDPFRARLGGRVELLEPAVDVAQLSGVKPASCASAFRVGFVNHCNEVKGLDLAISAFERFAEMHPGTEFVVAGTGRLEHLIDASPVLPSTERFGFLPERERLSLMASLDAMVLPFRTGVSVLGLSQTVLECMALGVPVIGSNTASIAPAVRDGVDALLVDPGRPVEGIVTHLNALASDEQLRARLSSAAVRSARDRFDVRSRAADLVDRIVAEGRADYSDPSG